MSEEEDNECEQCGYDPCECCSSCHSSPYDCDCCSYCGAYCECCGECGDNPCSCFEGYGTSTQTPWEKRGHNISRDNKGKDWKTVWPEIDDSIDPIMAAADFYILEAVAARIMYDYEPPADELTSEQEDEFLDMLGIFDRNKRILFKKDRKSQAKKLAKTSPAFILKKIEDDAKSLQKELVDILDWSFSHYVHIALAGEVRHHRAVRDQSLNSDRNYAWSDWRRIYETVGNEALLDLEALFLEFDDCAYGGPKWAEAAKVLYLRAENLLGPTQEMNKKIFVDRVFSIEHNGGALLDKISWDIKNTKKYGVGYMQKVLNYHAADIPQIHQLYRLASPKIKRLFMNYVGSAVGITPIHKEFLSETLLEQLEFKPKYQCRSCLSDASRGHCQRCRSLDHRRPFIFKSGGTVFDPDDTNLVWDDDEDIHPNFKLAFYPVGPYGESNIDPEMQVKIEVSGNVNYVSSLAPGKIKQTFAGQLKDFIHGVPINTKTDDDIYSVHISLEMFAVVAKPNMDDRLPFFTKIIYNPSDLIVDGHKKMIPISIDKRKELC